MHHIPGTKDIRTARSRMCVRILGHGTPILFVHGALSDAHVWSPIVDALCANHMCIIPDMTGYGESERPGAHAYAYNEDSWTEDALDVLTALGISRAHLMGHGEGAHVAIQLAARAPSIVISLTALASPLWSDACAGARNASAIPGWGSLALAAWVRTRTARGDVTVGSMLDKRGLDVARAFLRSSRDDRTLRAALATLQTPMLAILDRDAPDHARVRLRHDTASSERVQIRREQVNELRRGIFDPGFAAHLSAWLEDKATAHET